MSRGARARRRAASSAAVASALFLALVALAPAATPRASLTEIESEVMCPVCGTLLELAESPQAQREKAYVQRLVREGRTKDQIKDALVAQYGDAVLALPKGSGFSLSAYIVPIIGFALAAVALALGVLRWRRNAAGRKGDGPGAEQPSAADRDRLDADLARYDL